MLDCSAFPPGEIFLLRAYVKRSGDIFGCHN
jgi:hypothetical protein